MKRSDRRFSVGKVNVNLTNRVAYTLIAFLVIAIVSVFVYAQTGTVSHPASQITGQLTDSQITGLSASKISNPPWLTSESDPKIATLQADNYCTANSIGTQITCTVGNPNTDFCAGGTCGGGLTIPGENDLYVGRNAHAAGYFYTSSDKALKTNIKPISNSLDKIQQLEGVSFDWKNSGVASIGFIAQDVEKVFPELVSGEEGSKAVAYGNIVAVLVEAVKELKQENNKLKQEICVKDNSYSFC